MEAMATAHDTPEGFWFRDPKTGRLETIRGAGSMKGTIDIDVRIDLTKPIWEQVLKLEQQDREAGQQDRDSWRKRERSFSTRTLCFGLSRIHRG